VRGIAEVHAPPRRAEVVAAGRHPTESVTSLGWNAGDAPRGEVNSYRRG
jgi:hypothetical protein